MASQAGTSQSTHVIVSEQSWQDLRARLADVQSRLDRLEFAGELSLKLAGINRFMNLAMAICNEVAARVGARRVSLGLLKGRYVHVIAMNQTENVLRKTQLVARIEEVMEECLDQDADILYPPQAAGQSDVINRCASRFVNHEHIGGVILIPLRRAEPLGVLMVEFEAGKAIDAAVLPRLRTSMDMLTPRLLDLYHYNRWFGARWASEWRQILAAVLGPTHTWIKLAAVAGAAFLGWICFAKGTFRVDANFTLKPLRAAQIDAPFDGYIKAVMVRPGDRVIAGQTILALLHTAKLRDELAAASARFYAYAKQADLARSQGKIADMQVAEESQEAQKSKMTLLREELRRARITSAISGVVLTGELKRRIGEPVKLGELLFRVAPIRPLRARIDVADTDILYVKPGQHGSLATASLPAQHIKLVVTHITPMAVVKHKATIFRVRARLIHPPGWLRPGMQGTARITVDKRPLIWIWTRGLVNWLRMKLWF